MADIIDPALITVVRPAPTTAPTVITRRVHGVRGPAGPPGTPGADAPSFYQHTGQGPPTIVPGAQLGEGYLDILTGNIYVLV